LASSVLSEIIARTGL